MNLILTVLNGIISAFMIEIGIKDFLGQPSRIDAFFWPLVIFIIVIRYFADAAKLPCIKPATTLPVVTFFLAVVSEWFTIGFWPILIGGSVLYLLIMYALYEDSFTKGLFTNKVMGKLILLVSHFINGFCYFLLINEIVDYQKMGVEKVDALVVPIVLDFMLISHLVLRNGARRTFLSV